MESGMERTRPAGRGFERPAPKRPPPTAGEIVARKKVANGDMAPIWDAICDVQKRLGAIEEEIQFVARVLRLTWRGVRGAGVLATSVSAIVGLLLLLNEIL